MRTIRTGFAGPSAVAAAWVLAAWAGVAAGQTSVFAPEFEEVRRASVVWDRRPGPARQVVDVVCLVPDEAAFLEAVSAWDASHYFPILIDDVELTFKFLRAFRPARVVRLPGKTSAAGPSWDRALAAVGKAWSDDAGDPPRGDVVPKALGPVPPGAVVSAPDSPSLAGAVALAAGRFQPLLKWETAKHFNDAQTLEQARDLATDLEGRLSSTFPRYHTLGDDLDFVTLAGDYPYRYDRDGQAHAFDDLILRSEPSQRRWAFAGRLTGDARQSVYRAMCSLFLHPPSALLYNTYDEKALPWSQYAMGGASSSLSAVLPTDHVSGGRAALPGWYRTFEPFNRFGLILLNTHGGATDFHLARGPGQSADVPESVPAAVLMIHSFSAQAPDDPRTVAGRWLANGAYAYYGSMNEPFLMAFRTPALVASFLAENLPVVAAVRQSPPEPFGRPWRLVYLGDPLYRIRPVGSAPGRLPAWDAIAGWPAYGEFREPEPGAPADRRLTWVVRTAVFRLQAGVQPRLSVDPSAVLLGIVRDRLEPALRPVYDELVVDTLLQNGRVAELIDRLARVPPAERSPSLRRHLETAQTAALARAAEEKDFRQACALWVDVIRDPSSLDFARVFTERVGRLADTPGRLHDWDRRLFLALGPKRDAPIRPAVEAEWKRVELILRPRGPRGEPHERPSRDARNARGMSVGAPGSVSHDLSWAFNPSP